MLKSKRINNMDKKLFGEKFRHYEFNNGSKNPYHVTICTLIDNGEEIVRGISICSFRDQYNRRIGNTIARGRAIKAARDCKSFNPIREELKLVAPFNFKSEWIYKKDCPISETWDVDYPISYSNPIFFYL